MDIGYIRLKVELRGDLINDPDEIAAQIKSELTEYGVDAEVTVLGYAGVVEVPA